MDTNCYTEPDKDNIIITRFQLNPPMYLFDIDIYISLDVLEYIGLIIVHKLNCFNVQLEIELIWNYITLVNVLISKPLLK